MAVGPNYFSSDFYVLCHYDKRYSLPFFSGKGHQGNVCIRAPPTKLRHWPEMVRGHLYGPLWGFTCGGVLLSVVRGSLVRSSLVRGFFGGVHLSGGPLVRGFTCPYF